MCLLLQTLGRQACPVIRCHFPDMLSRGPKVDTYVFLDAAIVISRGPGPMRRVAGCDAIKGQE